MGVVASAVGVVCTEEVSVVVSEAVALVQEVFVAALCLPNAVVALALAVPVLAEAGFAQPRRGSGVPILPVEVSADQPVRSDTTTEAAARLPLGRINSADGETNR